MTAIEKIRSISEDSKRYEEITDILLEVRDRKLRNLSKKLDEKLARALKS